MPSNFKVTDYPNFTSLARSRFASVNQRVEAILTGYAENIGRKPLVRGIVEPSGSPGTPLYLFRRSYNSSTCDNTLLGYAMLQQRFGGGEQFEIWDLLLQGVCCSGGL